MPGALFGDALRTRLADIDATISYQRSVFRQLRQERKQVQLQLDSLVYDPVLKLPPEITSDIFIHCLPVVRAHGSVNTMEAPMLLSHVSKPWREIALSTRALWAEVDLDVQAKRPCVAEIFKSWLERGRGCPLSVKLRGPMTNVSNVSQLFKTFQQHSQRMCSLELDMSVEDVENMVEYGVDMGFPLLQKLVIRLLDYDDDLEDEPPIDIFSNAPLLREVFLRGPPPSSVSLPWQQLNKFTGELYTVADCLEALQLSPNITECAFAVYENIDLDPGSDPFSHSTLKTFTLFKSISEASGDDACSAEILSFLALPGLQTLQILDSDDFDDDIFDSFLTRSAPPLRKLCIRLEGTTEIAVTTFVSIPGLTDLEIWRPDVGFLTDLLGFFGWDYNLLPQLTNLSFLGCICRFPGLPVYHMLEILEEPLTERWNLRLGGDRGVAALQSFRLLWETDFGDLIDDPDPLLAFKRLAAEGMNVQIESKTKAFIRPMQDSR
ncbi:hypothetical protein B0H10DRAFT_2060660 [Mycena sp. CBHHK59/15]|nr:hypothetical protein B0H10DRAFT_2060660 [Mycena sp. CBHHK59/15]